MSLKRKERGFGVFQIQQAFLSICVAMVIERFLKVVLINENIFLVMAFSRHHCLSKHFIKYFREKIINGKRM